MTMAGAFRRAFHAKNEYNKPKRWFYPSLLPRQDQAEAWKMYRALSLLCLLASLLPAAHSCVLVTGATGFVAGHIVEILLAKNYTVHGTVRDVSSPNCEFLREMNDTLPGTLHLFAADLRADRPFDRAVKGCTKMLHVASVVVNDGMSNAEQVNTAVKGTESALEAARVAGVKDVVVTSSTATVQPTKEVIGGTKRPYTTQDVNDVATEDYGTYAYSKGEEKLHIVCCA